jgi:hypothetical protein
LSRTVFIGAQVPPDLAAAIQQQARHAERSVAAELRLALRDRVAGSNTNESPAGQPSSREVTAGTRRDVSG